MRTRLSIVVAIAAAAWLTGPAVATGATVTLADDLLSSQTLTPGVAATTRNMSASFRVANTGAESGEASYRVAATGPGGPQPSRFGCLTFPMPGFPLEYQGNGSYAITVTTFTGSGCSGAGTPTTYPVTINAGTTVTVPSQTLLTRSPATPGTSSTSFLYQVQVERNPGETGSTIAYALNSNPGPDGALQGSPKEVPAFDGRATVGFERPGTYSFVAAPSAGGYPGISAPWSAPVKVKVKAPFDFSINPMLINPKASNRPVVSATIGAEVSEPAAIGRKVRIELRYAVGKWRSLGTVRVRKNRSIVKRYRTKNRLGRYWLRFTMKSTDLIKGGSIIVDYDVVRVKKRR